MWLNLLVLLMLVLITFFQSLQGLFAALILLVLSVISSVVALAFYEDIYNALLAKAMPGEGQAISLMALFLVTLLVLRLIADMGFKGNVHMPQKADRIGGGVLGFFVAMVMTGMTVTAIQMLPFDREVLGYARHEAAPDGRLVSRGVWFGPDRFAVGLAQVILDGSLAGKASREGTFEDLHPDLLADLDARRSAGVPYAAQPGSVSLAIDQVWLPDRVLDTDGKTQVSPDPGKKFIGVRTKLGGSLPAAFTPLQARMVAQRANRLQEYILKAASRDNESPSKVKPLDRYKMSTGMMNLVYEIPAEATPWYVTFNSQGYGEVTEAQLKETSAPALTAPGGGTPETPKADDKDKASAAKPRPQNPAGRTHGADVTGEPIVSEDLPEGVVLPRNEIATSADLSGKRLRGGHIVLETSKIRGVPAGMGVSQFEVPKGQRLVQVPLHRVVPGSLAGQAIDFTLRTLQQQWALNDEMGGKYLPVGAMAIATTGGKEIIELQYHIEQENLASGHTLDKWRRINDSDLKAQADAKLVFLYLVPPGKHIIEFDTGRKVVQLDMTVK